MMEQLSGSILHGLKSHEIERAAYQSYQTIDQKFQSPWFITLKSDSLDYNKNNN